MHLISSPALSGEFVFTFSLELRGMTVETTGDRELALRFETFPARAHAKLVDRITALTDTLRARVEAANPVSPGKSGQLRSEIAQQVFADKPDRVAGISNVLAGGDSRFLRARRSVLSAFGRIGVMLFVLMTRPPSPRRF